MKTIEELEAEFNELCKGDESIIEEAANEIFWGAMKEANLNIESAQIILYGALRTAQKAFELASLLFPATKQQKDLR